MLALVLILLPCLGREANSQPHPLLSIVPSSDHLEILTRESRQPQSPNSALLGREPSQQCYKNAFSCQHPLSPTSELRQWRFPKIDFDSKFQTHKDVTSWPVQNPKLSQLVKNCLCQSEPVKSGGRDHLLKCGELRITKKKSSRHDVMKGT